MKIKLTRFFANIILLVFSASLFGQMEKADRYFMRREYNKAIPLYEKATMSDDPDIQQMALLKLGDAYRLQGQYPQSEKTYKLWLDNNANPPANVIYNYAQVLKSNKKYDEAASNYARYIELVPGDFHAKKAYRFCKEISAYQAKPREYEVTNVSLINTSRSEFSPFIENTKLIYVAERGAYDAVNGTFDETEKDLFLQYYYSDLNGSEVGKSKIFSPNLGPQFHMGPACFSSREQILYFTKVLPGKTKDAAAISGIFTATNSVFGWTQATMLNLASPETQAAQPSVSRDGKTLFFSSDRIGGYGGKDLWRSEKQNGIWSLPVNLGPDINTTGDEMYPYLRNDSTLFFSSNGLPGIGGLDICSATKIMGKWILSRNEGLNLNSNADDFGITFLNDSVGYFSSNREGGIGLDDIYSFRFKKKTTDLSGILLLTENLRDYAKYKKILLMDDIGKTIDSTQTDAKGRFSFRFLEADKVYLIAVVETDPELVSKARFYLAQNEASIQRVSQQFNGSRFVFRNLPVKAGSLPELYTDDKMVFAGTLQYGELATPFQRVKMKIANGFGDVVKESSTNEYGGFAFRNIPEDQNYVVFVEDADLNLPEGTRIELLNKSGKVVRTFYKTKEKFQFKVLQADTSFLKEMNAEDANLVMGIEGILYDQNLKVIANAKIKVKDSTGFVLQESVTNEGGKFTLKNLPADKNYLFELDDVDGTLNATPKASVKKIYIADSRGKVYKSVDLTGTKFVFKILEADKFFLGEFVVDDPWLKVADLQRRGAHSKDSVVAGSITIVENIYYAYGDYKLDTNAEIILNRAVRVLKENPNLIMEISSHTDSKSSADFNLNLSKKRAQTAVDYLVANGIEKERLKATGYGESRLLNKCSDNVECTEEEHRVNRRTEFKIMRAK